jgi:hypothetical protein
MRHARENRSDFAHPVEQELARLFDALSIRWRYEPPLDRLAAILERTTP